MKKKVLVIAICAVVVVAIIGGRYMNQVSKYREIIAGTNIRTPDLALIADGVYFGSYDANMIAADVRVTMEGHEIKSIELVRHYTDRGQPAEIIIDQVIAKQTLAVDTVSGATNSSKVILKAIEIALTGEDSVDGVSGATEAKE